MRPPALPKMLRCAIYTRKSTEHNLDLAFNSLDAQREACEAYIRSQAHEGWRLVADRYDDGGLSGASLERPAVQRLLADVRSGGVDVIVVYKVDRLTRSLADFARLVELFDGHGVSFVSVTQSFNTTSSMGRLTLNVLLSFAQFEREVIGERVRDKIAASKRKGLWVGGPVPLGYRSVDKTLRVDETEAATVRTIFERYLAVGSIGALVEDLPVRGVRPRLFRSQNGEIVQRDRFMVGPLAHILKNRFYIGEVVYRGATAPGEHPAIVDRETFAAVQARLAEGRQRRRARIAASPALLTGLLFDDAGNAMTPSHASKRGVRYRYYVSQAILQRRMDAAGSVTRVSATEIEAVVAAAVRAHLQAGGLSPTGADAPDTRIDHATGGNAATVADGALDVPAVEYGDPAETVAIASDDRALLRRHVARVVIGPDALRITLRTDDTEDDPAAAILTASWRRAAVTRRKGVAFAPDTSATIDDATRDALLAAIGKARRWIAAIEADPAVSFEAIAASETLGERYVRRLAALAFLSPRLVRAIANGAAPANLTVSALSSAPPLRWREQERRFGIA